MKQALEDAIEIVDKISIPVDVSDKKEMLNLIKTSIGTKFVSRWSDMMCNLALDAVRCVAVDVDGRREVDIKRYARVEKVYFARVMCYRGHCVAYMFKKKTLETTDFADNPKIRL